MYLLREFGLLPVFALTILWAVGGWLICVRLFDLKPAEHYLVGFGIGMTLSNWLANLLVRLMPLTFAFWLSTLIVLAFGIFLAGPVRKDLRSQLTFSWGQWLAFLLLAFFFTLLDRGLGILDDHQNLPILSMMATGDIPPHFPYAQNVVLGYHYFLLLLGTQFMVIGHAAPWVASDLAHGITMALTFMLSGLFAARLLNKAQAQFWGVLYTAFAGGARWLLLLLPLSLLAAISSQVQLIGSTAEVVKNLQSGLNGPWLLDGQGPVPFPFAFVSGINNPGIMALSGFGLFPVLILLMLLLTGSRIKDRIAWPVFFILLASLALANEVTFGLTCAGFFFVILFWLIQNRSLRFPEALRNWIVVFFFGGAISMFQGGMLTEVARGILFKNNAAQSYYDVSFHFVWPPSLISSHLGVLSLLNPSQLLAGLFEIGPAFLIFPLVLSRGKNEFKSENWFEAGFVFSSVVSLAMVFFQYSGTAGPTATTRLYGSFLLACTMYAVPLGWAYFENKSQAVQGIALTLGFTSIVSGVVLLTVQLYGMAHPVASYFVSDLDTQAYQKYWNKLPKQATVFDFDEARAVTVFGRSADTNLTFYVPNPKYAALVEAPDPYNVHAAGFDYMYYNLYYWQQNKKHLEVPCAKVLDQFTDIHNDTGAAGDFRRLVDITACTH
jgi:hypothetical protein